MRAYLGGVCWEGIVAHGLHRQPRLIGAPCVTERDTGMYGDTSTLPALIMCACFFQLLRYRIPFAYIEPPTESLRVCCDKKGHGSAAGPCRPSLYHDAGVSCMCIPIDGIGQFFVALLLASWPGGAMMDCLGLLTHPPTRFALEFESWTHARLFIDVWGVARHYARVG